MLLSEVRLIRRRLTVKQPTSRIEQSDALVILETHVAIQRILETTALPIMERMRFTTIVLLLQTMADQEVITAILP